MGGRCHFDLLAGGRTSWEGWKGSQGHLVCEGSEPGRQRSFGAAEGQYFH